MLNLIDADRQARLKAAFRKYGRQGPRTPAEWAEYNKSHDAIVGVTEIRQRAEAAYVKQHGHSTDDGPMAGCVSCNPDIGYQPDYRWHRELVGSIHEAAAVTRQDVAQRRTAELDDAIIRQVAEHVVRSSKARPDAGLRALLARKSVAAPRLLVKSFTAQTSAMGSGLAEVYFSATGGQPDRQGDVIVPGAFKDVIANGTPPPVVYGHDWNSLSAVLGKVTSWAELMPGDWNLPAKFQQSGQGAVCAQVEFTMESTAGSTAYSHLANGVPLQWSFGFTVPDGARKYDQQSGATYINSIDEIYEISLVLVGAQQNTLTGDVS